MKILLVGFIFVVLELNVAFAWFGNNCRFNGQAIENSDSGLVLDGKRDQVTLESFNDKASQRWIVNHTQAGRAYILNEKTKYLIISV